MIARTPVDAEELSSLTAEAMRAVEAAGARANVHVGLDSRKRQVSEIPDAEWTGRNQPSFDPAVNSFRDEDGFWIEVRALDAAGRPVEGIEGVVGSGAARVWRDATLHGLLSDDRMLHARPSGYSLAFAADGETAHVRGVIAYAGAVWVRRDFRSRGMAPALSMLLQAHALGRHDADYVYCVVEDPAFVRGRTVRFGFRRHHHGAVVTRPDGVAMPMWVSFNNRADVMGALRDFAAGRSDRASGREEAA